MSGYLLGNHNAEIHYWFIEEDPDNKPIFVDEWWSWLFRNGWFID